MRIVTLFIFFTLLKLAAQKPNTLIIDANHLMQVKKKLQHKDPATVQLVNKLKKKADALLNK